MASRLQLDVSERSFELIQRALLAYMDSIVVLAPGYETLQDHEKLTEVEADYYHGANLLAKLAEGRSTVKVG